MLPTLFIRAANLLGKPWGINAFPRAFANHSAARASDRRSAFDLIYRNAGWPSGESRSGDGSERERARPYVQALVECLDALNVRTLFDAPCGDLNWIAPAIAGRGYIGGDIAPALIADLHRHRPDLDTRLFDICEDEFPAADLWHCRDCLFHLPLADIRRAFGRFAASDIPYALLTTHKTRWLHRNLDVPIGGFRYLDLERAPFLLRRARLYLRDHRPMLDFPRFVGLWTREDIIAALERWPAA